MDSKVPVADNLLTAFLAKLKSEEFFGIVEAHFEKGKIVRVKKHETLLEHDIKDLITA